MALTAAISNCWYSSRRFLATPRPLCRSRKQSKSITNLHNVLVERLTWLEPISQHRNGDWINLELEDGINLQLDTAAESTSNNQHHRVLKKRRRSAIVFMVSRMSRRHDVLTSLVTSGWRGPHFIPLLFSSSSSSSSSGCNISASPHPAPIFFVSQHRNMNKLGIHRFRHWSNFIHFCTLFFFWENEMKWYSTPGGVSLHPAHPISTSLRTKCIVRIVVDWNHLAKRYFDTSS